MSTVQRTCPVLYCAVLYSTVQYSIVWLAALQWRQEDGKGAHS